MSNSSISRIGKTKTKQYVTNLSLNAAKTFLLLLILLQRKTAIFLTNLYFNKTMRDNTLFVISDRKKRSFVYSPFTCNFKQTGTNDQT